MVNIIIYLENELMDKAQELVHSLLEQELVASASIDEDNSYYIKTNNNEVVKTSHTVITAQTKSLMFSEIVNYIKSNLSNDVPVFSMPLTQMNDQFNEYIKSRTRKV